jgi:putative transposase
LRNLETAYTNFFQKRAKFPNYHSKKGKNTFTVPQFATIEDGKLWLPKFKSGISIRLHREIKGKMGKVSLTKTPTGKYFVSVFTTEEYQELAPANKAVGVDLGLKDLLITSDGEVFKNNRYTKRYERKLAKHRNIYQEKRKAAVSTKTKGSKLPDFTRRLATAVPTICISAPFPCLRYDTICIEDLECKRYGEKPSPCQVHY